MPDEVDSWYSWVVVGVGFVVYFLNYGIGRITGLLYSNILTYYDVDREQASRPFLMGSVARAISGPVSGYLSHTFGFRFAITLGCLLSSFGIFASSFAPDIVTLCIFWSIYGFGYGMAVLIFPRVVNMFNEKHASSANGISLSGAPFAGMLLTPLTVALLKTYEMPGTILILSAIVLNSIPAIMLLRNPNSTNVKDRSRTNTSLNHIFSENFEEKKQFQRNTEHDTFKDLSPNGHCHDTETAQSNDKITADSSLNKCETPIRISLENSITNSALRSGQKHIFKPSKKQNSLKIFSIFCDPLFIIFSLVRCFCNLLFVIVPTVIVDFSIDKGMMRNQASYVLVAYSVGDLLGKGGLGWITDANYISRINYVFLWFCIMALSCVLLVWANGVLLMTAGVFLVATGTATNTITLIVLVGEFFKQEKQSMAMASSEIFLLPMAFGTAGLIGPVSGYLSHTIGFRFSVTLGCLLSTLGIFACSFAQNISLLCIFWFVHGFGYGMATSIYPRVINLFNKKNASKANGIATAGSSIAGILLSPLTVILLDSFGMPGTFLNLSGMMLNTIPAIMLLKDPSFKRMKYMDPKFLLKQSQKSMEDDTFIDIPPDKRCYDAKAAGEDEKTMVKINPNSANLDTAISHNLSSTIDCTPVFKYSPLKAKQNCLHICSIFWDPLFVMFAIERGFCTLLFVIVPTIIVDFSIDKGIMRSQASSLLVVYSVGDLLGKAGLGWITDRNYISRIKYAFLWFGIIALSWILLAWSNEFLFMAAGVFLIATGNATISVVLVVLISEFFEKEKQSMAMASSTIFLIPMSFGTAAMIGYFRDTLGSYDGLAYTLGTASFVCSWLVLLIPSISKWRTPSKHTSRTGSSPSKIPMVPQT